MTYISLPVQAVKNHLTQYRDRMYFAVWAKINFWIVAYINWLLRVPGVQQTIAYHMENGGVMCRVMRVAASEAVESAWENLGVEVDASDVRGLDKEIAQYLDEEHLCADNIKGLDEAVEEIITDGKLLGNLTEAIASLIAERMTGR